ncbi:MAG: hypothetical protein GY909_07485 [Oligoflexia bacterium]|nr:hypothetical protein [Oligoflexia bacterium]
MKKFFTLLLIALTFSISARDWIKVKIPGAKCGNGMDYTVFWDKRDSSKLAVEFMGGGVCWSSATCYGPNFRTWIHPIPKISNFSSMTKEGALLENHSMIYFPYCTGDVHAGSHVAKYQLGMKVHHTGYSNAVKAWKYFKEKGLIDFKRVEDLVLYGSSAGGIASFIHSKTIAPYLSKEMNVKKTILSDSPGLHFGKDFWNKFTYKHHRDFKRAFKPIKLDYRFTTGFVAPSLPLVCKELADWNIGIMQGSEDLVMSIVFGDISPKKHAKLIYSENGLANVVKDVPNCEAWVADTKMHTFLILDRSAEKIYVNEESAHDFANRIYNN